MSTSIHFAVGSALNFLTRTGPSPGSKHSFEEFGPLLELNDKISHELASLSQEETTSYELDPPRIVVVGLTSAGKSSLLERIIGFKIFPVRDNVCTRRPFRCQIKKGSSDIRQLRFLNSSRYSADLVFELPKDIDAVRAAIEAEQDSANEDNVKFSANEIIAEITSPDNQTFTFTDLPGVFLVSETKMGGDYAESRKRNESLKDQTIAIIKRYLAQKNTIVLVVVSAADWMHGMNNDNLIGYLAEWLERVRKEEAREVPVYGVITKLDTQGGLSENSPIKKVLLGQLPKNHILNGLGAIRWIPMVSSPLVLAEGIGDKAAFLEQDAVVNALKTAVGPQVLSKLPIGRAALLRELKAALLHAISRAYGPMRKKVDEFVVDLDDKLKRLPVVAQPNEKRRILDGGLKLLESCLNDLIGTTGRHVAPQQGERTLRIQLLVDAPEKFASELHVDLRGDVVNDVEQLVNQAALEQGGSFDSDVTFVSLSQKIIERFRAPCMALVTSSAAVVAEALRVAVREAFGDYRQVSATILEEIGVSGSASDLLAEGDDLRAHFGEDGLPKKLFPFLTACAADKVLSLLDGLSTMTSCHPMWRNFDSLYHEVLLGNSKEGKETPLQAILALPELARRARTEGEAAVAQYEQAKGVRINPLTKGKISKHFARVEVMGYIIRSSLLGTVFPVVLRDIRDGLFRGVRCAGRKYELPLSSLLRAKLLFDPQMEKKIMDMMDPSAADMALRTELTGKRDVLLKLKKDFNDCSANLAKLVTLFDSAKG